MKIDLADDALKTLVSEAIFASLDEAKRGELIKAALAHLMTPPPRDNYSGRQPETPLQEAFHMAVRSLAHQVCREAILNNAEIKAQVAALWVKAWEKVIADESTVVSRMADGLIAALTPR